jgi:hypothetical protein
MPALVTVTLRDRVRRCEYRNLPSVSVGNFRITDVPTLCIDDSRTRFEHPAFVLGDVALGRTMVSFDMLNHVVTASTGYDDVSHSTLTPEDRIWQIEWLNSTPAIHATIAGHPALLLLDTGSSFTLVSQRFADRYVPQANGTTVSLSEQAAAAVTGRGREAQVRIGDTLVDDMVLSVPHWRGRTDGCLGASFLRRGRFTIDYLHGKALFEPYQ